MITKYDWVDLKAKWFISPHHTVIAFLREEIWIKKYSWWIYTKTNKWSEEKLKLKMEAKDEARDNAKKILVQMYTPTEKQLSEIHESLILTIHAKAVANTQKIKTMPDWTIIIPPDINMGEIDRMWNIVKTEKGEPTKISEKDDFVPLWDGDEEEDVIFYLPDNQRELWPVKQEKQE